jgi:uncharacterized protein YfiM (DUF2279 family)
MKQLTLLVVLLLCNVSLYGQVVPVDKVAHAATCYAISTATYSLTYNLTQDRRKATIYGFAAAVAVGVAKELYDTHHGNPEWGDLAADVTGAAIGVTVLRINF